MAAALTPGRSRALLGVFTAAAPAMVTGQSPVAARLPYSAHCAVGARYLYPRRFESRKNGAEPVMRRRARMNRFPRCV